jgi:hypothetical protein
MRIGLGIRGVALVAPLGDYTWYTLRVRHSIVTGIIHGAVLLTAFGAVLGRDCAARCARRRLERDCVLSGDGHALGPTIMVFALP